MEVFKMEKVYLKDLPNRKDLIGKRINITRQGGKYHYDYQDVKHIRTFRGAEFKTIKDGKTQKPVIWVYWYWDSQGDMEIAENMKDVLPYGIKDCGYSGVTLSENYKDSYLLI
jgi:hypothetical protein